MTEIDGMLRRVRQPAVVEHMQEQIPDVRVRFLELVEQHDRERLLADAVRQRLRFAGIAESPRILRVAPSAWILAHVADCTQLARRSRTGTAASVFASCVLPVPAGPAKRKTAIGLAGIGETGLEHRDAIDDGVDGFVLAAHARGAELPRRLQVDALRDRPAPSGAMPES